MAIGTRSGFIHRYLSVFAPASLVWEFADMPLFVLSLFKPGAKRGWRSFGAFHGPDSGQDGTGHQT